MDETDLSLFDQQLTLAINTPIYPPHGANADRMLAQLGACLEPFGFRLTDGGYEAEFTLTNGEDINITNVITIRNLLRHPGHRRLQLLAPPGTNIYTTIDPIRLAIKSVGPSYFTVHVNYDFLNFSRLPTLGAAPTLLDRRHSTPTPTQNSTYGTVISPSNSASLADFFQTQLQAGSPVLGRCSGEATGVLKERNEAGTMEMYSCVSPSVGGFETIRVQPRVMAIIKGEVGDCLSSTILDSGASIVLVNDKSLFTDFREIRYTVGTANDPDALTIEGGGTVSFKLFDQEDPDEPTILTLGNVAYAPDARFNIISVSYLAERAHLRGEWSVHGMTIVDKDRNHLTTAKLYDGLYYIQLVDQEPIQSNPGKEEVMTVLPGVVPPFVVAEIDFLEPVMMWHRKLGHLSLGNLRKLVKMSHGINLTDGQIKAKLEVDCPVCGTTKHTNRIPRDPATRRSTQAGKVMHVDTWGPYPVQSWDKAWYVMTFTDDAKRFTWEDRFQFKSQIPDIFLKRHRRIEKELGTTIDTYRFDNEFW
ncbi:unnamed protein product [Zymoseptoria tritici ST99CH_3D1]|nr:unnamed protein product [Zymoseptoria tritici ST99CH_3D1]